MSEIVTLARVNDFQLCPSDQLEMMMIMAVVMMMAEVDKTVEEAEWLVTMMIPLAEVW